AGGILAGARNREADHRRSPPQPRREPARRSRRDRTGFSPGPTNGPSAVSAQRPAQAGEHRLLPAQVLLGDRLAELLEQRALLVAQPARDLHVDDDAQVAVAVALQSWHPLAAQRDHLTRLRSRRDLDRHRTVQRRHLEARAEGGQRRRHIKQGDQIVPLAHEALVVAHADQHVEVTGPGARLADVAAAADAHPLAVGDAGRHVDRHGALRDDAATAAALRAGLRRDAPVTTAFVADDGAHDLPERRARYRLAPSGPAAALAGLDRRARFRAVAVAMLAAVDRLV